MRLISLIFLIQMSVSFSGNSQTDVSLNLKFGKKKLNLNQVYSLNDSAHIQLTTVRFYMMDVVLYSNGVAHKMDESAKLIDAELDNLLVFKGEFKTIDSLSFLLGTDDKTNTSGVLEGDLDPINGMYWAWNSGYINFKLEGIYERNNQKKALKYHLGGYAQPFQTAQQMVIVAANPSKSIVLDFKLFFESIPYENTSILIPGKEAAQMMNLLANSLNE